MATTVDTPTTPADAAHAVAVQRRRSYFIGSAATAVAVGGALAVGLSDSNEGNSAIYVAAAALIVGAVLFAWAVPSRIAVRGTGLVISIVSVPLLYFFWSGIPFVVGAAGVVVALAHRATSGAKRGQAIASAVIGGLVALLTVLAFIFG